MRLHASKFSDLFRLLPTGLRRANALLRLRRLYRFLIRFLIRLLIGVLLGALLHFLAFIRDLRFRAETLVVGVLDEVFVTIV